MKFINVLRSGVKRNSPIILSATAGVGVIATAYLASKATLEAAELIRETEKQRPKFINRDNKKDTAIDVTKLVWRLYVPTAISAVSTISCIAGANRIQSRKTLAAQAAFAVSERVYSEYRDKVIEEYGESKDKKIRDSMVEDRVKKSGEIIIAGSGGVLCCELFTGRYFDCDIEALRRSVNELNKKILAHDYATFNDFYYMVGISQTTESGQLGWKSSRLMELEFTSVLAPNDVPCLAFDYNYYVVL
jgi:hypothetical protein